MSHYHLLINQEYDHTWARDQILLFLQLQSNVTPRWIGFAVLGPKEEITECATISLHKLLGKIAIAVVLSILCRYYRAKWSSLNDSRFDHDSACKLYLHFHSNCINTADDESWFLGLNDNYRAAFLGNGLQRLCFYSFSHSNNFINFLHFCVRLLISRSSSLRTHYW